LSEDLVFYNENKEKKRTIKIINNKGL